jgi:membrane protein involved in colicin uptake
MTDPQKADDKRAAEARAADDKKKTADHKADDKKKQADHKADDKHAADKHKAEDKLKVIFKGFQIEVAFNFHSSGGAAQSRRQAHQRKAQG